MSIRVDSLCHVYHPGTPLETKALSGVDLTVRRNLGCRGWPDGSGNQLSPASECLVVPLRQRCRCCRSYDGRNFCPTLCAEESRARVPISRTPAFAESVSEGWLSDQGPEVPRKRTFVKRGERTLSLLGLPEELLSGALPFIGWATRASALLQFGFRRNILSLRATAGLLLLAEGILGL